MTKKKNKKHLPNLALWLAPFFIAAIGMCCLASYVSRNGQNPYSGHFILLCPAVMFLGMAWVQLKTGYRWKNLCPGNRGKTREQSPFGFWSSSVVFMALFVMFYLWSLLDLIFAYTQ
ncbi:MAG TPA: hypothetical protein DER01_10685 [Phycisphaerales bacterium]|nr:hypothetical protein [Phycisphaerales bacterium]